MFLVVSQFNAPWGGGDVMDVSCLYFSALLVGWLIGSFAFFLLNIALFSINREHASKEREEHSLECSRQGNAIDNDVDFVTPLRKFILEAVGGVDLNGFKLRYCPRYWSERMASILSFAVNEGIVSAIDVQDRLSKEIKRNGRLCFEQYMRGEYPDHTFWPAALAYAIQEGEFSEEEIRSIRFDHDQTTETFVEQCGERELLEKAFLKLLKNE